MRFMLMMNAPRGDGHWQINDWSPEDFQAHIGFIMQLQEDLTEKGLLVAAEGLGQPSEAKRVRAGNDGRPITDGVFPESKEFLAGYWIIEVDTPEQAYDVAAHASTAPGPGGAPLNMSIEVRQVMSGPPPVDA